jgi:predicted MFS family arabinose efflux permease
VTRQDTSGAAEEWKRSWGVVLAGALGIALASVPIYSSGAFIEPIEKSFDWSRGQISLGMTLVSILGMSLAPFIGYLVDRFGPRRIGIAGAITFCGCFASLSFTTSSLWSWLGLWFVLGLAGSLIKPTIWTTGVSSVFDKGRGLALSAMLCGTALGSTFTPILSTRLIDAFGWRFAFVGVAAAWGLVVIPIVILLFSSAADRHRTRGNSSAHAQSGPAPALFGLHWREAMPTWKFVRLAGAAFIPSFTVVAFVANLIPIFSFTGIERNTAASIAGLVGISTVVGRLTGGYLLDRINGGIVGGVSMLLPVISSLLVLSFPGSVPMATLAVLVLGLSLGAELDAVAYLTTRHFGLLSFGVIFGTISGLLSLATGLGPLFVNTLYDMTGSYYPALTAYIPLCLLASLLFFSLGRYPVFETRETNP